MEYHLEILVAAENKESYDSAYADIERCHKSEIEIYVKKQHLLSSFLHDLPVPSLDCKEEECLPLYVDPKYQFSIDGLFVHYFNHVLGTWH